MNKSLKPTYWHKYDGKSLLIFDDIFHPDLVEAFGIMMMALKYERRPSFDNELSVGVENDYYKRLPTMPNTVNKIISKYYKAMSKKQSPQKLSHLYAASMRYGDHTMIHHDIDCPDCITFLYYGNLYWDSSWGGETIFFDDNKTAMFAVNPKPGRLALFNAQLFHRGGVPQRDCPSTRYGLSIFYRCAKQLNKIKK
jgi:hypothetical protein